MNKLYFGLLFLIIFISCGKDDPTTECPECRVLETPLLKMIDFNQFGSVYQERYNYDQDFQLVSISSDYVEGSTIEVVFKNGQLNHYLSSNDNAPGVYSRIDSVIYNVDNRIQQIITSRGQGDVLQTYEYTYDSSGKLNSRALYFNNFLGAFYYERYEWDGLNIKNIKHYRDQELQYEVDYEYDEKINFRRGLPNCLLQTAEAWSENNVIKFEYTEHALTLDLACNPCVFDLDYNEFDQPISFNNTEIEWYWDIQYE